MINEKHLVYLPIEELSKPRKSGLCEIFVDYYWFVTPDRHVIKYCRYSDSGTYQCNKNKLILERMLDHYPNCTIEQLPLIIVDART